CAGRANNELFCLGTNAVTNPSRFFVPYLPPYHTEKSRTDESASDPWRTTPAQPATFATPAADALHPPAKRPRNEYFEPPPSRRPFHIPEESGASPANAPPVRISKYSRLVNALGAPGSAVHGIVAPNGPQLPPVQRAAWPNPTGAPA